ncbi:MAG TPA: TPM domain-containing protein [Kiritimatiellia bacterium]|nr:TPM domain-containing protein [Kiritimatiellia bacterium]
MRIFRFIACAIWLAAAGAHAQIESDRFRESLVPQGHVSDWAGVFTPAQKADLESRIAAVRQATGAQLAVVALKSLQGGDINDFAVKLFAQWGIGEKGKDNGVLLLAAIEDRAMWIEVGYGLEGVLNDAKCGRIRDEWILPRFKGGDYARGLSDGADALLRVMGGETLPEPAAPEENPLAAIVFLFIFAIVFILIVRSAIRGGKGGGEFPAAEFPGAGFPAVAGAAAEAGAAAVLADSAADARAAAGRAGAGDLESQRKGTSA